LPRRSLTASLVLALLGTALAGGPAQAGGPASAGPDGAAQAAARAATRQVAAGHAVIAGRRVTDARTAQRLIEAYWTPARMRAAVPVDKPAPADRTARERADRPGRVGRAHAAAQPIGPRTTSPTRQAVNASPGVGKVFFTANGKNYVCSGSTVNNPAKNLVSTAGHCVHGGKGGTWHSNWAYVPGYRDGSAPFGVWAAKEFTSVKGWTKWSFSWWDFAFVTMWTNNGQKLVHRTGGHGISFNYPKNIPITLLAYPSAAPFTGQVQIYCQGSMYPKGVQQVGFTCLMTKGSSGGPFLRAYDNTLRFGYVNSNIAHGPDDKSYGPYFDDDVAHIYAVAKHKS